MSTKKRDEEKTRKELIAELNTLRVEVQTLRGILSQPSRGLTNSQIRERAEDVKYHEPDWGPNYAGG